VDAVSGYTGKQADNPAIVLIVCSHVNLLAVFLPPGMRLTLSGSLPGPPGPGNFKSGPIGCL